MVLFKQIFTGILIAHVAMTTSLHSQPKQESILQSFKSGLINHSEPIGYTLMGVGLGVCAWKFFSKSGTELDNLENYKLAYNGNFGAASVHSRSAQHLAQNNNNFNFTADHAQVATNRIEQDVKKMKRRYYAFAASAVVCISLSGNFLWKALETFRAPTGK